MNSKNVVVIILMISFLFVGLYITSIWGNQQSAVNGKRDKNKNKILLAQEIQNAETIRRGLSSNNLSRSSLMVVMEKTSQVEDDEGWESLTKLSEFLEAINEASSTELKQFLVEAIEGADPFGGIISDENYEYYMSALAKLMESDQIEVVDWLETQFSLKTKDYFVKSWLEQYEGVSDRESSELAVKFLSEKMASDFIGDRLVSKNQPVSTEDAIFYLNNLEVKEESRSKSEGARFASDFDFLTFTDQAIKGLSSFSDLEQPSYSKFPNNLFYEWAKRNPKEAFEYYDNKVRGANINVNFNRKINLVDGYTDYIYRKVLSSDPGYIGYEKEVIEELKSAGGNEGNLRHILRAYREVENNGR